MRGSLSHIELYVSDLAVSAAFWGWFLQEIGYRPYQEWPEGRSWKLGKTYFVVVQASEEHRKSGYHRKRVGLNHLAFHAQDRSDVDAMTEKLKAQNVPVLYTDRHPHAGGEGVYAVFFEDPDRIKVEFAAA